MASRGDWLSGVESALRPPPRLSLSDWADSYFCLSAESAAEPGRWRTLPYQRGVMDAITDPSVERVTWMKSARVGATKCMNATVGYYMHQDPCPILVVQPTVEDAQGYSKEEVAPMLRDCKVLAEIVTEPTSRVSENTILHKTFPGGSLSMVGANSPRGFRRVSRRVVIFDEVDGYPPSAGTEGDQIKLGIRRSEFYWNRKIIAASTPTIAGASRIEQMFEEGDRRRYHVPCPHCGHMDILAFREGERGHWMRWPEGKPEEAYFVCKANGCIIEHHDKAGMLERGEWRADGEFSGHASFHIWAAYSLSPNAAWGILAQEFVEAKKHSGKLQTFVNTALGETWQDRGEAPEWERLYQRREKYPIGSVPARARFLTAGIDVQKDRLVYQVDGWAHNRERWLVEAGVIPGDIAEEVTKRRLDEFVARTFPGEGGGQFALAMTAIDSGYNTQEVYNWARRHPMSRVIATKGVATAAALVIAPSSVDVSLGGAKLRRGYKVWPIGVSIAKNELYSILRLQAPTDGEAPPPGYYHFPEVDQEFFKQLTAEHLVTVTRRGGFPSREWQLIANRENHWLDTAVMSRVAAAVLGVDRLVPDDSPVLQPKPQSAKPRRDPFQPKDPRGKPMKIRPPRDPRRR